MRSRRRVFVSSLLLLAATVFALLLGGTAIALHTATGQRLVGYHLSGLLEAATGIPVEFLRVVPIR